MPFDPDDLKDDIPISFPPKPTIGKDGLPLAMPKFDAMAETLKPWTNTKYDPEESLLKKDKFPILSPSDFQSYRPPYAQSNPQQLLPMPKFDAMANVLKPWKK